MRNQNRITQAQARQLMHLPSNGHPIIVCCRSGQRSAIAAELLAQAGRQVYDLGSINCWDGPLTR